MYCLDRYDEVDYSEAYYSQSRELALMEIKKSDWLDDVIPSHIPELLKLLYSLKDLQNVKEFIKKMEIEDEVELGAYL